MAALGLCGPVEQMMSGLAGSMFDWTVPFRLVAMIAGLVLLAEILRVFFRHWAPKTNRGRTAFTLANSALRYILGLVGLMWALAILGVDVKALLAGTGVVALIIGFGAESLIADVITGIFMLFEHQYEVGDIIVAGDFRGTVTQIGIRTTSITDTGGNVQIINNSDIRNLINRSNDNSFAVCDIGIPYQGYLRKAEAILEQTLPQLPKENPDLFPNETVLFGKQSFQCSYNREGELFDWYLSDYQSRTAKHWDGQYEHYYNIPQSGILMEYSLDEFRTSLIVKEGSFVNEWNTEDNGHFYNFLENGTVTVYHENAGTWEQICVIEVVDGVTQLNDRMIVEPIQYSGGTTGYQLEVRLNTGLTMHLYTEDGQTLEDFLYHTFTVY